MLRIPWVSGNLPKVEGLRVSSIWGPAIICAGGVTKKNFIMNLNIRGHEEEPYQKTR